MDEEVRKFRSNGAIWGSIKHNLGGSYGKRKFNSCDRENETE